MSNIKVAYCTGFWCTNIGNAFFSLGIEYVLKNILGQSNVTVVSDFQTYTTSYGKRLYPHKNQLNYIKELDVDYVVLAGPVISKYFLKLWKDTILELKKRGIGYIILSAGIMKMNQESTQECKNFFEKNPPYVFVSRDEKTYNLFGKYATNSYNGICFSFFAPDYYKPCNLNNKQPYWVYNFDKIKEPIIYDNNLFKKKNLLSFEFANEKYYLQCSKSQKLSTKTDRFTDALIYIMSMLPEKKRPDNVGRYRIIRTDHRFHPHFRSKIYKQNNSFCADLPYGYLNLYANSKCTLSDRVHACAVTLAFGNSAMLFAKTNRIGLLERVGINVKKMCSEPVKLDLANLKKEKNDMINWLTKVLNDGGIKK